MLNELPSVWYHAASESVMGAAQLWPQSTQVFVIYCIKWYYYIIYYIKNLNGAVLDLIEFQNKKIRQSFVFQKKESHKNGGGGGFKKYVFKRRSHLFYLVTFLVQGFTFLGGGGGGGLYLITK